MEISMIPVANSVACNGNNDPDVFYTFDSPELTANYQYHLHCNNQYGFVHYDPKPLPQWDPVLSKDAQAKLSALDKRPERFRS